MGEVLDEVERTGIKFKGVKSKVAVTDIEFLEGF
jgi:hypothetical protein